MIAFIPLLIIVFVTIANAQEWVIDTTTTSTTLVGVSVSSNGDAALGASASNNIGAQMIMYDGTSFTKTKKGQISAGLLMACANTPGNQVQVATSMAGIALSTDGGVTYANAAGIGGLSQSASIYNNNQNIGLVGTFATTVNKVGVSGVATSGDNGASWTVNEVGPYVRYGAFPSANTWYVSAGKFISFIYLLLILYLYNSLSSIRYVV